MPTVVATSDLHGCLPDIPDCDLLLIAGDLCCHGGPTAQAPWLDGAFRQWLNRIPAKEVVAIAGNHDWIFERTPDAVPDLRWHYLQDSGIELFGQQIYGTPWQPWFNDWAFNIADEADLDRYFAMIPDDTDILLTHGPALGYGDQTFERIAAGSPSLLKHILRVRPKLHVCGHIHEGYGEYEIGGIISANVSYVDMGYRPVNRPMMWEL